MSVSSISETPAENKPGVSNLLTIYACLNRVTIEEAVEHFKDANYGTLKSEVADTVVNTLAPVQAKYYEYLSNREYLDQVLAIGRAKAEKVASAKVEEVYAKLGLVLPRK